MNRSLAYVGLGVILTGIALVASPIVLTGRMDMDLAPLSGLIVAPVGLGVVGIAAASIDPRRTTVHTFGNDEAPPAPKAAPPVVNPIAHLGNPKAPVRCPNCRTVMTYEMSRCPRCAEDRPCRMCGKPLDSVDDRATCPQCQRAELFCNCSQYRVPSRRMGVGRSTLLR